MFPERSAGVSDGGEKCKHYTFDLRLHVIAKCGKGSKETADRWQNISLCQTNMLPRCM